MRKADFKSKVAGIPCGVRVLTYEKGRPMRITGSGFGDADPPEYDEFEFELLDREGYPALWLHSKLTCADEERLLAEWEDIVNEFR